MFGIGNSQRQAHERIGELTARIASLQGENRWLWFWIAVLSIIVGLQFVTAGHPEGLIGIGHFVGSRAFGRRS